MVTHPQVSVVIPVYNEEHRLPVYLEEWLSYLPSHFSTYEIIIADDGSTDGLAQLIQQHVAYNQTVFWFPLTHQGKGAAVRAGMLKAQGAVRLFADADGATPSTALAQLQAKLVDGSDGVAIGSRVALEGINKVERKLLRHYIGRVFATITSFVSGLSIYDTQCGFKLFTSQATEQIFSPLQTKGFAFDVEVLMRAKHLGLPVYEVPVNWRDKKGSKVNVLRDSLKMLLEIIRLRWASQSW